MKLARRLLAFATLFILTTYATATVDVPATVTGGLSSLNGLTGATQTFAVGTTGNDVAFSSATTTHTLNIPSASASARGVVTTGSQTIAGAKTFSTSVNAAALSINGAPANTYFHRVCTITSAAAATPVACLATADVPDGQKAYLTYWHAKVNGATEWDTTTSCVIEDTGGNDFVSMAVAALTANAFVQAATANVTLSDRFSIGSGSADSAGLQISCNANGTGSDLVVTVSGVIK